MADEKNDLSHVEQLPAHSAPQTSHALTEETTKGKDFTLSAAEIPKGYFRSANFIGSMFAIGASFGSGVASFAMIAPVLGYVDADIGPSPNLTWVALAYLLTSSIFLVIVGRLTDIFGRRWFFIFGSAVAVVGSIVCATAPNINTLIAGEVLLGFAAGFQLSYAFAISEIVPIKWRFLAQAYVCIWGIPTSGVAPAIAYAFVTKTSVGWRGIFYFLIGLNVAATASWYLFYRPPNFHMKHGRARKLQYLKEFDYVGTLLLLLGMLLFLMGISWGGTLHPWKSAYVICTIVIGFCLLVAFVLYEVFMPLTEPLVPMRLFKKRNWNICIILWALGAAVYYANAILWPSMVATLYGTGHSIMWVGWTSCVANAGILTGEYFVPLGASFPHRTRQIAASFAIGSILVACMSTCTPDTPTRAIVLIFLGSMFIGFNEIGNSTISTITIEDQREIGTAIGVASSIRSGVSTVCSTVFTTVLANRLAKTIPAIVPPALLKAGLPAKSIPAFIVALSTGTTKAWSAVDGLTPTIQATGVQAYQLASSQAYKTVFLVTLAFSGIGMVLSIFYGNVDHLINNDVSVQIHKRSNEDEMAGV